MCIHGIIDKRDYLELHNGDSQDVLKLIDGNSIDSIVTDPPYGLGFMGKSWDKVLPPIEIWIECLRVLKPGGYLVAMSASRTYHRLAVQLEDLGMICHPMIGWIYGSGFPKATDLSKQFDKQAGAEREVVGTRKKSTAIGTNDLMRNNGKKTGCANFATKQGSDNIKYKDIDLPITAPSTDNAKKWEGYKYGLQALKPALEPIAVFQKPWKTKEVKRMTDNVVKHGVGVFNIDACRVETNTDELKELNRENKRPADGASGFMTSTSREFTPSQGRHPANLLHDGSEVVEEVFLEQGGVREVGKGTRHNKNNTGNGITHGAMKGVDSFSFNDTGTASRFFNKLPITDLDVPFLYQAKASKAERGEGNTHPTVKPIKLMEWLIKLVTPEGGMTLDPFMGSGTTGKASIDNGFYFIGVEREKENFNIAERRLGLETTSFTRKKKLKKRIMKLRVKPKKKKGVLKKKLKKRY